MTGAIHVVTILKWNKPCPPRQLVEVKAEPYVVMRGLSGGLFIVDEVDGKAVRLHVHFNEWNLRWEAILP